MVVSVTQWTPDHCGCTISYGVDSDNSSALPNIAGVSVVGVEHSGLTGSGLLSVLFSENMLKNQVPPAFAQITFLSGFNISGNGYIASGAVQVSFSGSALWSFQSGVPFRPLVINTANISINTSQRNQIRSVVNATFGSGKVVIV